MRNLNPLEKDIEKAIVTHARKLGILVYKFTSPSRRSVPDRVFVLPGGRVFFMELKRKGQKPTPSQEVEIEKLRKQGATVYVVSDVTAGRCIISGEFQGATSKDPVADY